MKNVADYGGTRIIAPDRVEHAIQEAARLVDIVAGLVAMPGGDAAGGGEGEL